MDRQERTVVVLEEPFWYTDKLALLKWDTQVVGEYTVRYGRRYARYTRCVQDMC